MFSTEDILKLKDEGKSYKEIAEFLGTTVDVVKQRVHRSKQGKITSETKTAETWAIEVQSSTIRTVEDAIKEAKVDLDIWEVVRSSVKKYDQGSKNKEKKVQVVELWSIHIDLKRKVSRTIEKAFEGLLRKIPKIKLPSSSPRKVSDPHLCYIGLHDVHFGKLAWAAETGENYDLKIAEDLYWEAGQDLVAKAQGFPIEKFVLPVGHDFLHVDNLKNQTTSGTQVDTDGRFAKIFETGQLAVIKLVEYLRRIAPVEVMWIPGNHDYESSYFLCKVIQAWYRESANVKVDCRPTPRKAVHYGVNLIGCTHGCDEKHERLASLLAEEYKHEWAGSVCREVLLGHYHRAKETHYNLANHKDGVMIRVLPSLSGSDSWHFKKGYVSPEGKVAQALLYSKTDGFVAQFNSNHWK